MKYIIFILIVLTTSCKEKNSNTNIRELETSEINTKKDIKSVKPKQQNSKTKKFDEKRDSIRKIYAHNSETYKKLIDFYKTSNHKPSLSFDHVKHIQKYSSIEQIDGITNKPKFFIDYVIQNNLEKPNHRKYITDRKLLRKLKNAACETNYVSIKDTLRNGQKISIVLNSQKFVSSKHELVYQKKTNYLIEIDGKYPFGAIYTQNPDEEITELTKLKISIDDKDIETQISEYQNLYDPNFCGFGRHTKIAEAYEDGDNIYIYLFGGINADSYFAKLIFNANSGYIGKIVTDYGSLSEYGSFSERFIGY